MHQAKIHSDQGWEMRPFERCRERMEALFFRRA